MSFDTLFVNSFKVKLNIRLNLLKYKNLLKYNVQQFKEKYIDEGVGCKRGEGEQWWIQLKISSEVLVIISSEVLVIFSSEVLVIFALVLKSFQ